MVRIVFLSRPISGLCKSRREHQSRPGRLEARFVLNMPRMTRNRIRLRSHAARRVSRPQRASLDQAQKAPRLRDLKDALSGGSRGGKPGLLRPADPRMLSRLLEVTDVGPREHLQPASVRQLLHTYTCIGEPLQICFPILGIYDVGSFSPRSKPPL